MIRDKFLLLYERKLPEYFQTLWKHRLAIDILLDVLLEHVIRFLLDM